MLLGHRTRLWVPHSSTVPYICLLGPTSIILLWVVPGLAWPGLEGSVPTRQSGSASSVPSPVVSIAQGVPASDACVPDSSVDPDFLPLTRTHRVLGTPRPGSPLPRVCPSLPARADLTPGGSGPGSLPISSPCDRIHITVHSLSHREEWGTLIVPVCEGEGCLARGWEAW